MEKIELLLPAGNWDCLKAAVENGADAIYFGVQNFNARRKANNFSLDEVKKVVDYCHKNGVKAYCTLNTLIKNKEMTEFWGTVKELYLAAVDAIIIQHFSFISILKQNFPGLEIHLSTQASVSNTYFYDLVKDVDRVILPREFSQKEVKNFVEKTKIPAEIFVQGALCFSYSGKCLFSSFLGGRSGNRGLCAQPCRKKYSGSHLLSMKELCLIEKIPQIIESGVSSLKVEGRLRTPKYVTAAAKAYRLAIDSYYSGKFGVNYLYYKDLKLSFNREFTEGYFSEDKNLVSSEKPIARGLFLGTIDADKIIKLEEDLSVGDGLGIWFKNKVDGAVLKKMDRDGVSVNFARAGDTVKLQIKATPGTSIYKTSSKKEFTPKAIRFEKNEPIFTPKRDYKNLILPEIPVVRSKKDEQLVKVYSVADGEKAQDVGVKVFYNIFAKDFDPKFGAFVPRILADFEVERAVKLINDFKIKDILIGDLGVYALLKNSDLNLYLDYSANVFNDYDLLFFENAIPIISPELSFKELSEFRNRNFAVLTHGRIIFMNTKYDHLPNELKDEKNYVFPVRREHTYYQILNSVELGLFQKVLALKEVGIKKFFFDLDSKVPETLLLYQDILAKKSVKVEKSKYTKGHWEEGVL